MHDLGARQSPFRAITSEEVTFYQEHGWVKLEGLVTSDLAAEMLKVAQAKFLQRDAESDAALVGGNAHRHGMFTEWRYPTIMEGTEPFASVGLSKQLGKNAQLLVGRPAPIRLFNDLVVCKVPTSNEGSSGPSPYHQDLPNWPMDRVGGFTLWIALDDVTPDQGSMRFVSGSQHEGPLGGLCEDYTSGPDHLEQWPQLAERYKLSSPMHLKAGDATCHHSLTVHGAPENTTTRLRWSYLILYIPDDTLYTGADSTIVNGLGLKPRTPFEHERFPVVYP